MESTEVPKKGREIQVGKYSKEYRFLYCRFDLREKSKPPSRSTEVLRKNVREVNTHETHTKHVSRLPVINALPHMVLVSCWFLRDTGTMVRLNPTKRTTSSYPFFVEL
jgi:hypothetical protein